MERELSGTATTVLENPVIWMHSYNFINLGVESSEEM
jgi:hypothetical protein